MTDKTTIIFMGTPQFSVPILKALFENPEYQILAVVTQPDRKVGRKQILTASPVKQLAIDLGIQQILQPEKISGSIEQQTIINLQPDLIITAAFGQFLPTKILEAAKVAAINVHASLLPKHRGGAPIHRAIMQGDQQTGVSIMFMILQMDAGDVISQTAIEIDEHDNVGSLSQKLSVVGRDLLMKTLPNILSGNIDPTVQDSTAVTVSPNIKKEEQTINFALETAQEINQHVRGLYPTHPAFFETVNQQRITLIEAIDTKQSTSLLPGEIVLVDKNQLWIAAANQTVVSLIKLQPAGKKPMDIKQYLNGAANLLKVGEQLIRV